MEVVMAVSQHNNSAGGVMLLFILNELLSESRDIIQWSGFQENTGVNLLLLPISIICLVRQVIFKLQWKNVYCIQK